MQHTITVFEHQYIFENQLPAHCAQQCFAWLITQNLPSLKVMSNNGKLCIKAQHYVGIVATPFDIQIEILPKVFLAHTKKTDSQPCDAFKDSSIQESRKWLIQQVQQYYFHYGQEQQQQLAHTQISSNTQALPQWIADGYIQSCKAVFDYGLNREYQIQTEQASFIRGKVDIANTIRNNQCGVKQHVVTQKVDVRMAHTAHNRIIISALYTVQQLFPSHITQALLQQLQTHTDFYVSDQNHLKRYIQEQYVTDKKICKNTSLHTIYKNCIHMAKVILDRTYQGSGHGTHTGVSLMFNMHSLFEKIVHTALQNIKSTNQTIKSQHLQYSVLLDQEDHMHFQLQPDFVIFEENIALTIVDAKWKMLSTNTSVTHTINQADLYQMFTYASHYFTQVESQKESQELWLVYPKTLNFYKPQTYTLHINNYILRIIPLNLQSGCLIMEQL